MKLLEAAGQGNAEGLGVGGVARACGSLPLVNPGFQGHHPQQMRSQQIATGLDKQFPSQESVSHLKRLSSICLNSPQCEHTTRMVQEGLFPLLLCKQPLRQLYSRTSGYSFLQQVEKLTFLTLLKVRIAIKIH